MVQVSFAAGAVEGKLAMAPAAQGGGGVSPLALAMARMIGGAAVFHALIAATRARARTTLRDHVALAALSLLGVVLNQALFLAGLRVTSAVSATLLSATIPVFTAALAVIARQERANVRTGLGLTLALAGILWLTFGGADGASFHGVGIDRGALLVALNSLCYAAYLVFARDLIRRLGTLTVVAWVFAWGTLLFLPFGGPALLREAGTWSLRAWGLVAFVVVVPTIVAYSANAWALGRTTPTLVTIYIYLQPVLAALLAWLQLGQGLNRRLVSAALLVLLGVAVVATRGRAMRARGR